MSTHRIARLAGVSQTTVSLALNDHPRIPEATKKRILKIAKQIGYRRNARVTELMGELRLKRDPEREACLGVISFYNHPRPWENGAVHLGLIHEGMAQRAGDLGYRLEPFWLRAPGMKVTRFRDILDARGIKGLLCFGSPRLEQEFPPELDHFAVVTQGVSIATPLHRVTSHVYNAMWRTLKIITDLGYQRPGLVVDAYEGERNSHAYLCTFLGWSHLVHGTPPAVPVLQVKQPEEAPLIGWIREHRPDVAIVAHHYSVLPEFDRILRRNRVRVPQDLGVAMITEMLDGTDYSGMQGNPRLVGTRAAELLVARIMNRDFGLPAHPCIELVDMQWIPGGSLRPVAGRR